MSIIHNAENNVEEARKEDAHVRETTVDEGGVEYSGKNQETMELFKLDAELQYRTMGWKKALILFIKMQFATGVLSIPSCMHELGAVGGSILVVVWGLLAAYGAHIMGKFRMNHESIHSVGDAGRLIGGPILGEYCGAAYFISWVLPAGVTMLGTSIAFNAITNHATCTLVFTVIALVVCTIPAMLPRFGQIAVLTWFGFFSIFTAVFIVVVAVTVNDRPSAAPRTGPINIDFKAIGHPTFVAGITASNIILGSYGGTPAFLSAAAELRNPKEYSKAMWGSMAFTIASYLSFSLVVYAYCGQYVASPALGSAGPLIKKIAYGIAIPGLMITCTLFLHISAKHLMVRVLRGTKHLQTRTRTHMVTWYSSVVGIAIVAFVLASGIPFFNALLGLLVLFTAPHVLSLPMAMWFYDNHKLGVKTPMLSKALHGLVLVVGVFCGIAGAVAAVITIVDSFKSGNAGKAFSCADNS